MFIGLSLSVISYNSSHLVCCILLKHNAINISEGLLKKHFSLLVSCKCQNCTTIFPNAADLQSCEVTFIFFIFFCWLVLLTPIQSKNSQHPHEITLAIRGQKTVYSENCYLLCACCEYFKPQCCYYLWDLNTDLRLKRHTLCHVHEQYLNI